MNKVSNQKILLHIVNTWDISPLPEYRGFRCANCQNYKNEAYYHWLRNEMFFLPVHMCIDCELLFSEGKLQLDNNLRPWKDLSSFNSIYTSESEHNFLKIIQNWNTSSAEPRLTPFYCDLCLGQLDIDDKDGLRKGYHTWWLDNETLHELHFHNHCGDKIIKLA